MNWRFSLPDGQLVGSEHVGVPSSALTLTLVLDSHQQWHLAQPTNLLDELHQRIPQTFCGVEADDGVAFWRIAGRRRANPERLPLASARAAGRGERRERRINRIQPSECSGIGCKSQLTRASAPLSAAVGVLIGASRRCGYDNSQRPTSLPRD
jgi:hypothetical protein